mmetsp:Transcript_28270/g.41769  ORF Transcript_28270/g.41769 Transcript_28270/m.41769 type:complete len:278 (+) Transcript_28270:40-873(+)
MGSCCSRYCADLRYSFFAVDEPGYGKIDLDKTFWLNDQSTWYITLIKLAIFLLITVSFIHAWITRGYEPPIFFLAYLTHWTVVFQSVYFACSFLCTVWPKTWLVNSAWLMYSLGINNGLIVFIIFWATEYNPDSYVLDYWQVSAHGIFFLLTFLDGMLINRTPIRVKHVLWTQLWGLLFVIWTIIFTVAGIDNPFKPDDESQALYNVLDWENNPGFAAGLSAILLLVGVPLIHSMFWTFSLCRRCYIEEEDNGGNVEMEQMEEGLAEDNNSREDHST